MVKNLPLKQETQVRSVSQEYTKRITHILFIIFIEEVICQSFHHLPVFSGTEKQKNWKESKFLPLSLRGFLEIFKGR